MKNHGSCIPIFQAPWPLPCPTRKMSLLKCFPWQMETPNRVSEVPCLVCLGLLVQRVETLHHHHWLSVTNNKQLPSSFGWTWWKCSLGGRYCWCMHYCNSWTNNIASRTPTFERHPHPLQTLNMPELLQWIFYYCWERWVLHTFSDVAPKFDTTTTTNLLTFLPWGVSSRWTPRNALVEKENEEFQKSVPKGRRGCNSLAEDFEGKTVQQFQKR